MTTHNTTEEVTEEEIALWQEWFDGPDGASLEDIAEQFPRLLRAYRRIKAQLHANECAVKLLKDEVESLKEQLKIWEERISDKNAEIEKMEARIAELKSIGDEYVKETDHIFDRVEVLANENSDLKREIDKIKKCLEGYSHGELWLEGEGVAHYHNVNQWIEMGAKFKLQDPGDLARQCLDEINGGKP